MDAGSTMRMGVWSGIECECVVAIGETGVNAAFREDGVESATPQPARQVLRTADAEFRGWSMLWNEW